MQIMAAIHHRNQVFSKKDTNSVMAQPEAMVARLPEFVKYVYYINRL